MDKGHDEELGDDQIKLMDEDCPDAAPGKKQQVKSFLWIWVVKMIRVVGFQPCLGLKLPAGLMAWYWNECQMLDLFNAFGTRIWSMRHDVK